VVVCDVAAACAQQRPVAGVGGKVLEGGATGSCHLAAYVLGAVNARMMVCTAEPCRRLELDGVQHSPGPGRIE
jgi:hypothetical protein